MRKLSFTIFLLFSINLYADVKIKGCILNDTYKNSRGTKIDIIDLKKISKLTFTENTFLGKTTLSLYTTDSREPIYTSKVSWKIKDEENFAKLKLTRAITAAVNGCMK